VWDFVVVGGLPWGVGLGASWDFSLVGVLGHGVANAQPTN
jgi:hypothetical protein